jgi:hypothetical protein
MTPETVQIVSDSFRTVQKVKLVVSELNVLLRGVLKRSYIYNPRIVKYDSQVQYSIVWLTGDCYDTQCRVRMLSCLVQAHARESFKLIR